MDAFVRKFSASLGLPPVRFNFTAMIGGLLNKITGVTSSNNTSHSDSFRYVLYFFLLCSRDLVSDLHRSQLLCQLFAGTSDYTIPILQSNWDRAYRALCDAIEMYGRLHPDTYATIVIDEPSACFPQALTLRTEHCDVSDRVIRDLTHLAVYYACDKPIARVIFASSSAAVERLGMLLCAEFAGLGCTPFSDSTLFVLPLSVEGSMSGRSIWFSPTPIPTDELLQYYGNSSTNPCPTQLSNEQLKLVLDSYGLPRSINATLISLSAAVGMCTMHCLCSDLWLCTSSEYVYLIQHWFACQILQYFLQPLPNRATVLHWSTIGSFSSSFTNSAAPTSVRSWSASVAPN